MKRVLCFFLILLCVVLPLCACGGKETEEGVPKPGSLPTRTLNVYNWGQYISDGSDDLPDTNDLFEEYFNKNLAKDYGYFIEVNYSTYPSNEDMYNKIVSGSASFDVIVPSDYMIERMIGEDLLLPLDFEKLPNIENIGESFRDGTYNTYDPEAKYSVPYTYSAVGIIYNTNYVDEEDVGSWDLLWNEKYKGKILQFNNPRDAFGSALYSLGYSVNTTDESKWREAYDKLREQKPLVSAYVMDEIFDKMINGSAYIAPYYSGDFLTMYDSNYALAFYYPEEGTNFFVDAMCIPTYARNVDAAHAYIDFMLTEEPAIANAEYIGYGSPNLLVRENADYVAYMEDWHEDSIDILYNTNFLLHDYTDLRDVVRENEEDVKASFYRAQDGDLLIFTNDLWSDFKSENAIPPWIIVADVLIVGTLVGALVFFFVRRRIRAKYY